MPRRKLHARRSPPSEAHDEAAPDAARDWTADEHGRSNASEEFEATVTFVARLLENHRLGGSLEQTARVIVAQLAHTCRFAPRGVPDAHAGPTQQS